MTPLTFTFDLEDDRPSGAYEERHPGLTRDVLRFLGERGIRGTFFIVGEVGEKHPDLVREIAEAGHEVAYHGWEHVPLTKIDPSSFARDLERGRALLEDAAGTAVVGFRAPRFSLTPQTEWAVELLLEAGFSYSSSILPARSPLHGYPGMPRRPFRWPQGLAEFPCPVIGAGGLSVPFVGGVYMRYLPPWVVGALAARLPEDTVPWMYVHAYDFDAEQPFYLMPNAGWMTSRIVYHRRRDTYRRVEMLLDRLGAGAPLVERLEDEVTC